MDKTLAFSERRIEARVTERVTSVGAFLRDIALDRGELERQRRYRPAQAGQNFRLETLDIDLDEGG